MRDRWGRHTEAEPHMKISVETSRQVSVKQLLLQQTGSEICLYCSELAAGGLGLLAHHQLRTYLVVESLVPGVLVRYCRRS